MSVPINILIVEKDEHDVDVILGVLRRYGGSPLFKRIDDIETLSVELDSRPWDLILCSYAAAQVGNLQVLRVLRDIKKRGIPFIIFYDDISEEDASNLIAFGAQDCVPKHEFHRLMVAVKRGIDAAELRYKDAEIVNGAQSERYLLRQLMSNSTDLIVFKDLQRRYTHLNTVACKSVGLEESEIIGHTREEFGRFDKDSETPEIEERVMRTGVPDLNRLEKLVKSDGSVRWHASSRAPIRDNNGTITGLMVIARDSTEIIQKQIETKAAAERFRSVLDLAADAIVAADDTQRILIFNKGAEKTFGYSATEVVGQPIDVLLPERLAKSHGEFIENFGNSAVQVRPMSGRNGSVLGRRKDGTEFPAEASISQYQDEAGKKNYIAVVRDITARRQLEDRLAQSQKMEEVGQLAGGIAHDFNNLLMVVIGNLDLLMEMEIPSEAAVELIQSSLAAAMNGADLSKSLLTFSRQQVLRSEETNIGTLIVDHVKLLTRLVGSNITVETKIDDSIYSAIVDPAQLRSVLTNLVVNARDAMPGGGNLKVRAYNTALTTDDVRGFDDAVPGDYVVMEVSDSGCGISAEDLKHIYEPFFSTKEVGKGTGLGLSMVFGFVNQSKGKISVESELGNGTVFKLFLPRASAPVAQKVVLEKKSSVVNEGATILVVDDDLAVRKIVVAQLTSLGYKTIEAGAPAEALAMMDSDVAFDLLFTDIVMPGGLSGIDLARLARERRHNLKVLLTSGYPDLKKQHEDDEKTADIILGKPYRRGELQQRIGEVLTGA